MSIPSYSLEFRLEMAIPALESALEEFSNLISYVLRSNLCLLISTSTALRSNDAFDLVLSISLILLSKSNLLAFSFSSLESISILLDLRLESSFSALSMSVRVFFKRISSSFCCFKN